MTFKEYQYNRPTIETFKENFEKLLHQFTHATSFEEQNNALAAINDLRAEFESMYNLCLIRHTIDTTDDFYEKENAFFDNSMPHYQDLEAQYYKALAASKWRKQLEKQWGSQLFTIAELTVKTFKPTILENLQEENRLKSEFKKVKAAAKINFRGEQLNLAALVPYEVSSDRATRKAAADAKWQFFQEKGEQLDQIFDQLVKVRHQMAQKLGYNNFIELGYARMTRSDYTPEMVENFRQQVQQYIVPYATKLYQRQAKRIGLDSLKYYDNSFRFKTGNPSPKGSPEWILANAKEMYSELSQETREFFDFMTEKELLDVINRQGKATGGYCTFISKYQSPFIFSNFNGTSHDIDVLTHEAGHAFQVFSSRDIGINEYLWPTYEACEIHSMSMEFFTWPWMEKFFKEDTDKYKFYHLSSGLMFIPYGVAVDEFQHRIYENPHLTPLERHGIWKEIEQKYMPHLDYDGNEYLEKGAFWQRQNHIFETPFYYIDYTLAQVCAFQFWMRDQANHKEAWVDYVKLCKTGGKYSFLKLVELANLRSPFESGIVQDIVEVIKNWLDDIDDSSF